MKATYGVLSLLISIILYLFVVEVWCQPNKAIVPQQVDIKKQMSMKYILMWSHIFFHSYRIIPTGQDLFINNNCPVRNCFIVWHHSFLKNITDYDAVVFHGPHSVGKNLKLPFARSPNQLYAFFNRESSKKVLICEQKLNDNFFNMTITYRLDSDIQFLYLVVTNKQDEVIGPKKVMHWMKVEDMLPTDDSIKEKFSCKYKACAWLVSNCKTPSKREVYVKQLQEELQKYSLELDVYGRCVIQKCGISETKTNKPDPGCWRMIQTEYYFYLAFENSFAEDYVSEKLLNPLKFYTVPIVYGGANYTRFMPDGIYLDARKLGVKTLAKEIDAIIRDEKRYHSFFKWHNHYSYRSSYSNGQTDLFCKLCAYVNNQQNQLGKREIYTDFLEWWNGPSVCQKLNRSKYAPVKEKNKEFNFWNKKTGKSRFPYSLLEVPKWDRPRPISLLEDHN